MLHRPRMAKRLCGAVVLGPCTDTVLLVQEGDSWTLPCAACDEDRTAAQHLAAVDCVRQATGGLDVSAYTNSPPWVLEVRLAAIDPLLWQHCCPAGIKAS